MKKERMDTSASSVAAMDKIWCRHFECYKFVKVCAGCRVRIKCGSYRDYWSPPFDFMNQGAASGEA